MWLTLPNKQGPKALAFGRGVWISNLQVSKNDKIRA
jgi:hypothetical protein